MDLQNESAQSKYWCHSLHNTSITFGWFFINTTLRSEAWSSSLASPLPANLCTSSYKPMCQPHMACALISVYVPMDTCVWPICAGTCRNLPECLPALFYPLAFVWIQNMSYLNGVSPLTSQLPKTILPPFLAMEQGPHSASTLHGIILFGLILYKSCACCHNHWEFKWATAWLCP